MSEVAAATTAPTVTPIVINGGESPASFDELDAVEAQVKTAKRAEKQGTKDLAKEVAKEVTKKEEKEDSDEKEAKLPEVTKATNKEQKEADKLAAKDAKAKSMLKAKLADKEMEFDPDTVFTVKINGKDEPISLKDLQSQYSGRVAYDKKFSEMDRERKYFESTLNKANAKIKAVFEEQDPELRFYKMAELSGQDPIEVRQKFLSENMNLLEKWYSMSEDDRKNDAIAYENRIMKHQLESKLKEDGSRKSQAELETRISNLGNTHQFGQKDFWTKYDEAQSLAKSGKLLDPSTGNPIKITPEFISEMVVKDRLWGSAAQTFDSIEHSIPPEKRGEFLVSVTDMAYSQGFGPKEVKEIVDDMLGSSMKTKALAEKLDEQEEIRVGKKGSKKSEYKGDNEVSFFSDIM